MASITKKGKRWDVRIRMGGKSLFSSFDTEEQARTWAEQKEKNLKNPAAALQVNNLTAHGLQEWVLAQMEAGRGSDSVLRELYLIFCVIAKTSIPWHVSEEDFWTGAPTKGDDHG